MFPSILPETSLLAGKHLRQLRLITDVGSTDRYREPESTGVILIPHNPGKSRPIPFHSTVIARLMFAVIVPGCSGGWLAASSVSVFGRWHPKGGVETK